MSTHAPHPLLPNITPIGVINNEYFTVHIYENIALVLVVEGITLTYKNGFPTLLRVVNHFGIKPWVYISYRKNSYSVNPHDFKYFNIIPTLKGIAIVIPNKKNDNAPLIESFFSKKPLKVFNDLESGFKWAKDILNK